MNSFDFELKERIFMLDCGRKYYTPIWIKKLMRELKESGYNAIMLHFSEDMGLRLESKKYPWLAGGDHTLCVFGSEKGACEDDEKYLTQSEMADIVSYAHSLKMKVIPSFDSPGHMNYAVKKYNLYYGKDIGNYFHKNGKISLVKGSSFNKEEAQLSYSRGIDIANAEAVAFARALYYKYGKFFYELGCRDFDIGGDELLGFGESIDDSLSKWQNLDHWAEYARKVTGNPKAVAYDAFIIYFNGIAALMRSIGYQSVRMWNDDAYRSFDTEWCGAAELDKSIEIQYWSPLANGGANTAQFYIDRGHNVYNFNSWYSYYVIGKGAHVTPEAIEKEWTPLVFDHIVPENNPTSLNEKIKGAGYCLWSDAPKVESEDEVIEIIRPYFNAYGKKLIGAGNNPRF